MHRGKDGSEVVAVRVRTLKRMLAMIESGKHLVKLGKKLVHGDAKS